MWNTCERCEATFFSSILPHKVCPVCEENNQQYLTVGKRFNRKFLS